MCNIFSYFQMKVRIQHSMDINAKEIPSENKYFLLVATCQNEILQLSNLECTFLLIADTTLKFPEKLLQLYVPVMEQKFSNLRYCLLKKVSQIAFNYTREFASCVTVTHYFSKRTYLQK